MQSNKFDYAVLAHAHETPGLLTRDEFCDDANTLGINAIKKSRNFSLFATPYHPCR